MIIPFAKLDDGWILPDKVLSVVFNMIMECGAGKDLFFDGRVKCADDFIRDMKDPGNSVVFVSNGKTIVGGAWLNNMRENSAFGHFFALPPIWGNSANIMRPILDHWFSCELLDVIIAEYPACHDRVTSFLEKVGFTVLGKIPEIKHGVNKVGSIVGYLSREGYYGEK